MQTHTNSRDPYGLITQAFSRPSLLGRFLELPDVGLGEESAFPVDIKEHDDSYRISADLPGFRKEDVTIDLENNLLTVGAKKSADSGDAHGGKFVRRERTATRFSRSFRLPKHIDGAKVAAKLDHGVLELTLPKSTASLKQKIAVE